MNCCAAATAFALRGECASLEAGSAVLCRVFRAAREDERLKTQRARSIAAEYVSSRALVGIREDVLRFWASLPRLRPASAAPAAAASA
eukprot:CAMPEP_0196677434 /NCGR_PEP_ID=MMETSP1090-20130531/5649_1 /TAXON_ID=37098 /ORGANISM="Isochrysis sp, Strain CCMP1244" /LENGTH=87 /DNA_ID=CAMNT_0042015517 /DNA_START=69 /DNA_END=328 /DNA_ORIENTATION=+